jgi:hypothetical protein
MAIRRGRGRGRERGRHGEGDVPGVPALEAVFEGEVVLDGLLARAGSPHSAAEVAQRFAEAQAQGEERASAIPALFPEEPRFASPEEARRLYQNLFGLWAHVALLDVEGDAEGSEGGEGEADVDPDSDPDSDLDKEPDEGDEARAEAEAAARPPPPPLPERGSLAGRCVGPDLVEAVWQQIADLTPHERRRLHHRFESAQPDLVAWLAAAPLPDSGGAAAVDLTFEAWAMLDQAFGDRLGTAAWHDLAGLATEPPPMEVDQPALAAYVAEQLDNLSDDEPAFGPGERAQVERVLAAAVAALGRALE